MEEVAQPVSETKRLLDLEASVNSVNIAADLPQEELDEIAVDLVRRIKEDEKSMEPWFKRYEEYMKMALQVKETKTFPWKNAANVKYPIVTIAAMQFHARAYPSIVNNKSVVKGKVVGYDPSGEKAKRAERVGKHMTYQLIEQIENWDDDMDKLCLILPIAGCVFKQVSWDSFDEKMAVDLILPTDMIINYWAKSMEDARRITRRRYYYKNTVIEYQRDGKFLQVDLPEPKIRGKTPAEDKSQLRRFHGTDADDVPYEIYECQTYLDLDLDGYKEPYTVLIEPESPKILRITPNYSLKDIKKNDQGKIVRIRQRRQFIKYDFIPSPDGGLLGVGFGLLLGSLNEVVNTSINQLLDQGTMKTTGGGFIGKGIKMKTGKISFEPGEYKVVQSTGDDLRKSIVQLPINDPSPVLFNLLQAIDQKASQVIAISEISTGKLPGQNTPATTTISSIEEGMKLFNAIYKRIWRQLKKEFKRVFELNQVHVDQVEYYTVLDSTGSVQETGQVSQSDYNDEDLDVVPESDPNVASDALRLMKAQQLVELIPLGAVDPAKAGQRILEALDQPNPQDLMPQPQPDPAMVKAQAEVQKKEQEAKIDMFMQQKELEFREREMQYKEREAAMKIRLREMDIRFAEIEGMLKIRAQHQEQNMKHRHQEDDHQQKSRQSDEKHRQTLEQKKEKDKTKDGDK